MRKPVKLGKTLFLFLSFCRAKLSSDTCPEPCKQLQVGQFFPARGSCCFNLKATSHGYLTTLPSQRLIFCTRCFCDALDMDDDDERVEPYDPFKDFAERKPWWCGGGLEVREHTNPIYTKYYANFHGGCGCGETQTSMVNLSKSEAISLEERQKDAVQKVLGKVNVFTCRPSSSLHARALRSFHGLTRVQFFPLSLCSLASCTRTRSTR